MTDLAAATHDKLRVLAFYLPQFHPIPENDEWWGPGFTEWANVAKAKPLYRGHRQPVLPADLGFYDLRVPEVRERQADLARAAGIEGFIYWHYWFGNSRRILERPIQEVLQAGKPDFPFCLAWANQSWTGVWHGNPRNVLIKQEYTGPLDDQAHFDNLLHAFEDSRYVKVNGKPVFMMFDPGDHPDPTNFTRLWRAMAAHAGLPGLYLVALWNQSPNPRLDGFDAVTSVGPGDYLETLYANKWKRRFRNARRGDLGRILNKLFGNKLLSPRRYPYSEVVEVAYTTPLASDLRFIPSVTPNWDNTPRSSNRGVVFENSTPLLFAKYMQKAIQIADRRSTDERFIFIKSWNEWAEGNYLEPSTIIGHSYLRALQDVLTSKRIKD